MEHQIFSFGKMSLCDRCSTLYDLASLFRGKCSSFETWAGKIAKRIGTRPSALHSTVHFEGSLAELLRQLQTIDEVSQNASFSILQMTDRQKDRQTDR